LEFKKPSEFISQGQFSRDRFSGEIAETVSAFLNSNGGVLLIGVQTYQAPGDRKTELLKSLSDWIAGDTFEDRGIRLTASQVRDFIYGNLLPKPLGVEVKDLDLPVGDRVTKVFVVTVPTSSLGAHQSVSTCRYYRRTSDGDRPMLDYEIRDVNNRKAGPLLDLACKVLPHDGTIFAEDEAWKTSRTGINVVSVQGVPLSRVQLVFATANLGRGTANIVRFDIGIPQPWTVHTYSPEGTNVGAYWVHPSAVRYVIGNGVSVVWRSEKCREVPRPQRQKRISEQTVEWQTVIYNGNQPPAHPLWPSADRVVLGVLGLQRQTTTATSTWWWLPWRIFAEGMPEVKGGVLLIDNSGQLQVVNYQIGDVSWAREAEDEQTFKSLMRTFQVPGS